MAITRELMESEQAYRTRRTVVLAKLEAIQRHICEVSDADEARTPSHWGHAGDMAHVNDLLSDITDFLKVGVPE
jgi:hypothetical protein